MYGAVTANNVDKSGRLFLMTEMQRLLLVIIEEFEQRYNDNAVKFSTDVCKLRFSRTKDVGLKYSNMSLHIAEADLSKWKSETEGLIEKILHKDISEDDQAAHKQNDQSL